MAGAKPTYVYRFARTDEWIAAMDLAWRTFSRFNAAEYSEEGIRNFYDFVTDVGLYESFLRGEYQMIVALDGETIIGLATVRNGNHLSLLFVDEAYQGQGIGKTLLMNMCRYLRFEMGEEYMTLTAAPLAVEFYKKLGFRVTKPETTVSGIRVTGMEIDL